MKDRHTTASENLRSDGYDKYVRNRTKSKNRELAVLRQFFLEHPDEEIDMNAFEEFKKQFPEITLVSLTALKAKRTILRKRGVLE